MSTEKTPISVYDALAALIDQLASVAWAKLGLQPDPITGVMHKDLTEAKVAIDAVADLSQHLEPQLDDEDKRQIQNLLRDLRANFVNQSNG